MQDNQKIVLDYLKQCQTRGMADADIINQMVKNGWNRNDAETAVANFFSQTSQAKPKKKWLMVAIIILVLIIAAGAVYWFVFRNDNQTQQSTKVLNKNTNLSNQDITPVSNNASIQLIDDSKPILQVYGYEVTEKYLDAASIIYVDEVESINYYLENTESQYALQRVIEDALFKVMMDKVEISYPSKQSVLDMIFDTESNIEGITKELELKDLGDDFLNNYIYYYVVPAGYYVYLQAEISDSPYDKFNDFVAERVESVHEAFGKGLLFIDNPEQIFRWGQINIQEYIKFGIPLTHSATPSMEIPSEEISEWPQEMQDELLSLQNYPLTLTDIYKSDDNYYYFGFILPPEVGEQRQKLLVEDVNGVRIPKMQKNGLTQTDFYVDLLLEEGIENGKIVTLDESVVSSQELSLILDIDGDGLLDYVETAFGSDPYLRDTDGDGFNDKEEYDSNNNPNSK